jgi:hypothetical protein
MRKPRDLQAELQALAERSRALKTRRVSQLGELVIATGADALDLETLAGALLAAACEPQATVRSGWKAKGAAFFQGGGARSRARGGDRADKASGAQGSGDATPR